MVRSTVTHQVDTHSVRLAIHDPLTIDLNDNPHPDYPNEATVVELAVIYTTTTSQGTPPRTEVTSIAYVLDHKEHQTAFVHPDFLEQPDQWPTPVRELVEQHRPLIEGLNECPQCAAPATGDRIPQHRDGCPRNDQNL